MPGAMRVLERLDEEEAEAEAVEENARGERGGDVNGSNPKKGKKRLGTKPLRSIPALYRGLVKARRIEERDRRVRHDL